MAHLTLAHARKMLDLATARLRRAKLIEDKWHRRVSAIERRLAAADDARREKLR